MRRGRLFFLLAFLIFGAVGVYFLLKIVNPPAPPTEGTPVAPFSGQTVQIVLATQNISRGSLIPIEAVALFAFPADYRVETMMMDVSLVVGKRARQDIPRGVPITSNMLTDLAGDLVGVGSDAAIAIPPGFTAISIPMSRLSGVGFALRDGDKVDVLVTMGLIDLDPEFQTSMPNDVVKIVGTGGELLTALVCEQYERTPEGGVVCTNEGPVEQGRTITEPQTQQLLYVRPIEPQRPRLVTQRLVQYATVLHVGSFALPEDETAAIAPAPVEEIPVVGAPPAQAGTTLEETVRPPDIVTLIVAPQDALAINWAVKAGLDLALTLRAPGDAAVTTTSSVTLQYLLETYGITVPSKQPYGVQPAPGEPVKPVLPNDIPLPTPTPER